MEFISFCHFNFEKFVVQFPGGSIPIFNVIPLLQLQKKKQKVIKYAELKILIVKAESLKKRKM